MRLACRSVRAAGAAALAMVGFGATLAMTVEAPAPPPTAATSQMPALTGANLAGAPRLRPDGGIEPATIELEGPTNVDGALAPTAPVPSPLAWLWPLTSPLPPVWLHPSPTATATARATARPTATPRPRPTPSPTPRPTPSPTPPPPPPPPTPSPVSDTNPPTSTPYSQAQIIAVIRNAAVAHGVNPDCMQALAMRESGLNPNAYNPAGPYDGLFQFWPRTYYAHGGTNIWDPVQQSDIAATMMSQGYGWAWNTYC